MSIDIAHDSGRGPSDLLIATSNAAKAARLRWVFAGLGFRPLALAGDSAEAPEEDGRSFRENAEIKARFWSLRHEAQVAASDGGMAIPSLGSRWNALRTARAAGPLANDLQRAQYLLDLMRGLRGDDRIATWSEGLALARHGRVLASWQVEGTRTVIVDDLPVADLRPGFWAGSLCRLPSLGRTLASLSDDELACYDPTWSNLREQVQAYFQSGQAEADSVE